MGVLILNLDQVEPGSVLASPVYDQQCRTLYEEGFELNEDYIERLKRFNVTKVCINNDDSDLGLETVVKNQADRKASVAAQNKCTQTLVSTVKNMVVSNNKIKMKNHRVIGDLKKEVKNLIKFLSNNPISHFYLQETKKHDDYLVVHQSNVTFMSLILSMQHGVEPYIKQRRPIIIGGVKSRFDRNHLGLGALLHDTGKMAVPKSILKKPGPLIDDERQRIELHTRFGYDELKSLIPPESATIVRYHHLRRDGTGYPTTGDGKPISGDSVPILASLVGLPDVFHAMTSDRCYKKAKSEYRAAYEMLMEDEKYESFLLKSFVKMINLFEEGTQVKLSNNEHAVVIKRNPKAILNPMVYIVMDSNGNKFATRNYQKADLSRNHRLYIKEILTPEKKEDISYFQELSDRVRIDYEL